MDSTALSSFADLLIDDLTRTPATSSISDDATHRGALSDEPGPRSLAQLLDDPRPVLDEHELLAVMTVAVRLRNTVDHLIAAVTTTIETRGIPKRKGLKSGADMLTALGVAPAAAHRAVRVGRTLESLPDLAGHLRDGALSIDHADAVVKGLAHIATRASVDDDQRRELARRLTLQSTPAQIADRARELAIELAPDAPAGDQIPVAEDPALNALSLQQNSEGRVLGSMDLDVLTAEELHAALDPLCRPVPEPDGSPDPRSATQRRADAFGQIIRTYLSGSQRPTSGGVLPHVTLIRPARNWLPAAEPGRDGTPADDLASSTDRLGFTGPISVDTADLISCDAVLSGVLVDDHHAPLDVGRDHRLFTPTLRKALAVRDGGCAFPGCGRPASWCDAHHMVSWHDGGDTCVDNGVLLCRMHHTMVHQRGWTVILGHDRHPWFVPPVDQAHPERPRPQLRSNARRTLTDLPYAA